MRPIIEIDHISKRYDSGTVALNGVSLHQRGRDPCAAGSEWRSKTTLISIICGLVVPTGGTVRVGNHDIRTDWRAARKLIGLVPQEILLEPFEKVIDCVRFTRGLYGGPGRAYVEQLCAACAWDKARRPHARAVGRHEAPRADREGAVAPAQGAVSGRTDGGRRRGRLRRGCGRWCAISARGRDHHPDHALPGRGRGHGRPHRRHQSRPALLLCQPKAELMGEFGKST